MIDRQTVQLHRIRITPQDFYTMSEKHLQEVIAETYSKKEHESELLELLDNRVLFRDGYVQLQEAFKKLKAEIGSDEDEDDDGVGETLVPMVHEFCDRIGGLGERSYDSIFDHLTLEDDLR